MGAKKRDDPKNRKLDVFLKELEIAKAKREKILHYVEDLTFETIRDKSQPVKNTKLRLRK